MIYKLTNHKDSSAKLSFLLNSINAGIIGNPIPVGKGIKWPLQGREVWFQHFIFDLPF